MRSIALACLTAFAVLAGSPALANEVRVKDLGRFLGWRDNALVGYGIVTGLAGSGDSPRSEVTQQALKNVLGRLGANVTTAQVQSRNVAVVIVAGTLPASANVGDRIDVTVTSVGDARSLMGGTLLMTPLLGPDQRAYALAQGPLVVGGYRFDSNLSLQQKNYPTSATLPGGATVETSVEADLLQGRAELIFLLKEADATTAERIALGINSVLGPGTATVRDADAVAINVAGGGGNVYRLVSLVENVMVTPNALSRVVVNERTGTVVAGGGVQISSVVISQGDIKISVSVDNQASQPAFYAGDGGDVRSLVVTNTKLQVSGAANDAVVRFPNTTVGDLVEGLSRLHVDTRGVIAILQAIRAAGALHADIVVQ